MYAQESRWSVSPIETSAFVDSDKATINTPSLTPVADFVGRARYQSLEDEAVDGSSSLHS
jgi:hypothetical protein